MTSVTPRLPDQETESAPRLVLIREERSGYLTLALLLLITLCNGFLWSAAMPFNRGNDEELHFEMARFIAEQGRLPEFGPGKDVYVYLTDDGRVRSSYALHPSLPYILAAAAIRLIPARDEADTFHAARLPSVLWGAVTVVLAWLTARVVFPQSAALRLALPALVAFLPQFTFVSGYVNNDAFATAATSLVVYLVVRLLNGSPEQNWRDALALGVALGLVLLSKFNSYLVIPLALLAYGWSLRRTHRQLLLGLCLVVLAAALVGGWWPLRNMQLYGGDPFALNTGRLAWLSEDPTWVPFIARGFDLPTLGFLVLYWWLQTFITFWAAFGYTESYVAPHPVFYLGFILVSLGAVYGLQYAVPELLTKLRKGEGSPGAEIFLLMLLFSGSLIVLSFLNSFFFNAFQPQGRYLFPALVPLCILMVIGLAHFRVAPWAPRWTLLAAVFFVMASNLASLFFYVIPSYYAVGDTLLQPLLSIAQKNAWYFSAPVLLGLITVLLGGTALLAGRLILDFKESPSQVQAA